MGDIPVWLGTTLAAVTAVLVGFIVLGSISKHTQDVLRALKKAPRESASASAYAAPAKAAPAAEIPDRGALVAAVSACVATVLGTDPAGLRIVSLRKVD